MIKRVVGSLIMLFGVLLLTLPKTNEKSAVKLASSAMLMCTMEFRKQVEQQVIRDEAVSVEFRNTCPDLIASLQVSEAGDIVIAGNNHPLTMTLSPVVESGKVRWSCRGEPAASVAKLCKP